MPLGGKNNHSLKLKQQWTLGNANFSFQLCGCVYMGCGNRYSQQVDNTGTATASPALPGLCSQPRASPSGPHCTGPWPLLPGLQDHLPSARAEEYACPSMTLHPLTQLRSSQPKGSSARFHEPALKTKGCPWRGLARECC